MITLFYSPGGACSTASHIALEESGLTYEERPTLIAKREHKTPAYLAINPHGKVPALVVDGHVILETTAILTYVARQARDRHLLPTDPIGEAQCIAMMAWLSSTVHPAYAHLKRPDRYADDVGAQAQVREQGRSTFWQSLMDIEALLGAREWVMGDAYTVVDGYALVAYGWGVRAGLDVGTLARFTGWKDRMLERPAVWRVLENERNVLAVVEPRL